MRSTRTSTATLRRASRVAQRQSQSVVTSRQCNSKPVSKHNKPTPPVRKFDNRNSTEPKENDQGELESDEQDEEHETLTLPRRTTRSTPVASKRTKLAPEQDSPKAKKMKSDKAVMPSTSGHASRKALMSKDSVKLLRKSSEDGQALRSRRSRQLHSLTSKTISNHTQRYPENNVAHENSHNGQDRQHQKRSHSNGNACNGQSSVEQDNITSAASNHIESKMDRHKRGVADTDRAASNKEVSTDSGSDSEVILTRNTTRGSKRQALESLQVLKVLDDGSSDSDIQVCPSNEDGISEVSVDDLDAEDNEVNRNTTNIVHTIEDSDSELKIDNLVQRKSNGSSISRGDMEKLLKEMRREYEDLVRTRDEAIVRLRNELTFKEHQLEDLNNLATKNMELEARISAMLSCPEVYKKEVTLLAGKLTEENNTKSTVIEAKEKEKKTAKSAQPKEAPKSKPEVKQKEDSDIEVLSSDSEVEEVGQTRSSRKRPALVTCPSKSKAGESKRKTRRQRRLEKEESDDGDKIEALLVSDDEDVDDITDKTEEKGKKEEPKKNMKDGDQEKDTKEDTQQDTKEDTQEEEDKDDGTPGKGRHNIRKLLADKKLGNQTKAAVREEKERRDRVAKLKEKHLIVSHVDPKSKLSVCTKMVLAFKKDQKTPLVEVNSKLIKKLKPHQVEAVEFLWDLLIESVDQVKNSAEGAGCILAHCMGLGKTLSVITFVHTLLTHKVMKMKTCLVVCPLNTVLNWQYEWQKWLDKKDRLPTYEMASAKDNHQRAAMLSKWHKEGGIMIMGYQIFRILAMSNTKSKKKKKIFDDTLITQGADIIVCDEGHVLKNDASAISKCTNKIRSKRRIILTGTPLQNNLIEYHCMVSFVKPDLLGTRKEFCNRFVNPITNGQHADSTSRDVKVMKRRAHVLHEMLAGCVQRRDYSALVKFLPPKYEYVISVRLSPLQIKLYEKYLELHRNNPNNLRGASLFSDYQALMRIWTHPWVLKMDEIRQEKKMTFDEDDDDELASLFACDISEDSTPNTDEGDEKEDSTTGTNNIEKKAAGSEEGSNEGVHPRRSQRHAPVEKAKDKDSKKSSKEDSEVSGEEEKKEDGARRAKLIAGEVIKNWQTNSRRKTEEEEEDLMARKRQEQWWWDMIDEEKHKTVMDLSGKLLLLFDILRMAEGLGDKVLVFSQSILSLDLIEDFLAYKNEEAEKLKDTKKGKNANLSFWKKDEDYFRMDGSTSAQNRKKFTTFFNCAKNKRVRLFLISTKAGGLGINLECANRVIIFDASWNPSHDIQSIFRAYRFGQEKNVFIYRLLAQGTMEEKIYERQVTKETLSQRVIDEHQLDRHFTASDLQELYVFKPDRLDDPNTPERPTPKVPKDIILAELLSERKDLIIGYHEHDSLLEKRPEQDLSEEERKAAWDEYEREKQGIMYQYRPHVGSMSLYNYNYHQPMHPPPPPLHVPHPMPFGNNHLYQMLPMPMSTQGSVVRAALGGQASVAGSGPEYNKLNFQLQQLPRVVQEILKYNPNITPLELQSRLRAFMGMHSKYSNAPGFALPNNETLVGEPRLAPLPVSSTSTSQTTIPPYQPILPTWPTMPAPATLSQVLSEGISSAATSNMPSRLPQPGPVPANFSFLTDI